MLNDLPKPPEKLVQQLAMYQMMVIDKVRQILSSQINNQKIPILPPEYFDVLMGIHHLANYAIPESQLRKLKDDSNMIVEAVGKILRKKIAVEGIVICAGIIDDTLQIIYLHGTTEFKQLGEDNGKHSFTGRS